MSLHEPPSVSIDGLAIRRIREEKRLTQLYVAKVVGVTTDTVSRWENNRYPTIRRDNAINLAEALEVELDALLKQDAASVAEIPSSAPRKIWPLALLLLLLSAAAGWLLFRQQMAPPVVVHAKRVQPLYAAPGSRILIRLHLETERPHKGMIIKEQLPEGWKLIDAIPPASSSGSLGSVRWMLRNPPQSVQISYLLEVPAAEVGEEAQIEGMIITNPDGQRSTVPILTSRKMQIAPLHWVDADGNHVIDDAEILDISDLFDETDVMRSEWEQIEAIWDAGGYQWDKLQGRFVPFADQ